MHNVTKFIVVIAVIGAGVCAALPFRRLPPVPESTLAENDVPDSEPETSDALAANTEQHPDTDHVAMHMDAAPGHEDSLGIADVEQDDATGDDNPRVTNAPQIRARQQQESEFGDFADPATPPDLPPTFERSFGSDEQPVDDPYSPDSSVDDARKTKASDASENKNKKKTNPKKRGAARKRSESEGEQTPKNRSAKRPFEYPTADEAATGIPSDGDRPENETTRDETAEKRPWASDTEAETADDRRNFEEEADVAAREPAAASLATDEPDDRRETGFQARDSNPDDGWEDRESRTSASSDDDFASAAQPPTTRDAHRQNTAFNSASDQPARKDAGLPTTGNPGHRAPPASIAATRPPLDALARAAAEPTPRIARIEQSESLRFRNPQPQPTAGRDVRPWTNPQRPVTPQVPPRSPTAVASSSHLSQYVRHRVADGDSLASLAQRYLGNRNRYAEIFHANRHVLASPDILPIGVELVIPVASAGAGAPNAAAAQPYGTGGWQPRPETRAVRELVPIPANAFRRSNR